MVDALSELRGRMHVITASSHSETLITQTELSHHTAQNKTSFFQWQKWDIVKCTALICNLTTLNFDHKNTDLDNVRPTGLWHWQDLSQFSQWEFHHRGERREAHFSLLKMGKESWHGKKYLSNKLENKYSYCLLYCNVVQDILVCCFWLNAAICGKHYLKNKGYKAVTTLYTQIKYQRVVKFS